MQGGGCVVLGGAVERWMTERAARIAWDRNRGFWVGDACAIEWCREWMRFRAVHQHVSGHVYLGFVVMPSDLVRVEC